MKLALEWTLMTGQRWRIRSGRRRDIQNCCSLDFCVLLLDGQGHGYHRGRQDRSWIHHLVAQRLRFALVDGAPFQAKPAYCTAHEKAAAKKSKSHAQEFLETY